MNHTWLKKSIVVLFATTVFNTVSMAQIVPSFEMGVDTIVSFSYSKEDELKKLFKKRSNASGFSILAIKNTPLIGFGLSYTLSESLWEMESVYANQVITSEFRSLYSTVNAVIDVPLSIINLSVYIGGGQYTLSCRTSSKDCVDKAFKDAKFPAGGLFSSGFRLAFNFGVFYKLYLNYINLNTSKVKLEQKASDDIPNPQIYEYDPSASMINMGFSVSF